MRKEFQVLGWGEVLWNKQVKRMLDTRGPLLHPCYSYQESGEELELACPPIWDSFSCYSPSSSQQSQPWLSTPISTEETSQHLSISCEIWWNKFQCNRAASFMCVVWCVCLHAWRCLCTCVYMHVNIKGHAWVSISISLSLNLEVAISWSKLGYLASVRDLLSSKLGLRYTLLWLIPLSTGDAIQFLLLVWWALSQLNHLHGLGCYFLYISTLWLQKRLFSSESTEISQFL